MPDTSQQPRVKLEDLLQLKRAEQPDQAFWTHFDAELKQKTLQSVVEHESLWARTVRFLVQRAAPLAGAAGAAVWAMMTFFSPAVVLVEAPLADPTVAAADVQVAHVELVADEPMADLAPEPAQEILLARADFDADVVAAREFSPKSFRRELASEVFRAVPGAADFSVDSIAARATHLTRF
ncbi:MAG: hypothetical protein ACOCVG_05005 [Verrucomicrobiota bacterium]